MLARVYSKKKQRALLLPESESEYHNGSSMPRPAAPTMQQYQDQGGSPGRHQSARAHSSRMSRAVGHGAEKERKKSGSGFVKKVFGRKDREQYGKFAPGANAGDGVMFTEDDECELDEEDFVDEESEEEPQVLHHRRRFVRSGLTTYEQWISKNSVGRRFNRRSYMHQLPSSSLAKPNVAPGSSSPKKMAVDIEYLPTGGNQTSPESGLSSLSSALQEVINSQPTALKSIIDPSAGPARVQRSFVVEQTPDGNLFVASKRVPVGPTRQAMDDSFIGVGRSHSDQFAARGTDFTSRAGNLSRRSELDLAYRQKWEKNSITSSASGSSGSTSVSASAASLLSMSKVGVRRRLSGADRQSSGPLAGDSISTAPTAMAAVVTRVRRSSSSSRMLELTRQSLLSQMASKYMDHARQRSSSKASDGLPSIVQPRKESTAMLLQAGSFEDVDALPMTLDDLNERKHSIDKGPMTMDEFMFDMQAAPPQPPPPQLQRKGSSGKTGRGKRVSKAQKDEEEEEEEVDNMLTRSFLNLKDVDALKRSRSLEDEEKVVVTTTEETETEEEYPDISEERITDDYDSSYEDESAVRTSNITEFLGGYKGCSSMNRNSLGGRPSLGRNSGLGKNDFVSRAARSLRNSRKVAQESAKVSSELSRKLREARARVPLDLRGDPPQSTRKKRGFMGRDGGRRVRFDMTRYCREFEVLTPEPSDDEVQQWSQRDSEQDDDDDDYDDDDDEENRSENDSVDFGVPVPGAVLAAAMTDANAYYSAMPASALNYVGPMRYSVGRSSVQEDKRVSVVSRRSNANQTEVYM